MDNYDDENYDDGFDEARSSAAMQISLWRRLFTFTLPYKAELWVLVVAGSVTALMEMAYPLITKWLIDDVDANGKEADLFFWAIVYLGTCFLMAVSIGSFIWMTSKIRVYASYDIRKAAFANLQNLSFSFFDYRPVGWLMARMTSDCERLTNILAWGLLDLIWGVTVMLGMTVAMLVMNWKLALLVLAIVPILTWVSIKFQRTILGSARAVRRTNSRITGAYAQGIMGVLTSKTFSREAPNADEFHHLTGDMYIASVRNLTLSAIYIPIILIMSSVAVGLTLAIGGSDLLVGIIEAGTLVAFMMLARHFFEPVEVMGYWFAEMQMAQASAERVLSLIDAEPAIRDSVSVSDAVRMHRSTPQRETRAEDGGSLDIHKVELMNVNFAYEADVPILRDINLTAHKGETIAIVGPTGSGKSTLVNLVCRFYQPTSGQVLIDGIDYRNRSLRWLQSNLGVVLQNAHVFRGTVLENIRYGRLTASDNDVIHAAETIGAHEFINALENGYQTEVGEDGDMLSVGQKQLVSFARAILADPQILVMDEATSSVDTVTETKMQVGLDQVLSGRISFVIAHRLSTIRNADRIVVLDGGEISEIGDHAQLIRRGGHYAKLYYQQSLQEATRDWSPDRSNNQTDRGDDLVEPSPA
ncbi:MAG TPA: ABC transporter ATP-binding protein [Pseudomonadales bacterium]|nr:ABC transporter ATP-binding protein [Pseudomonadales bacterium]